METQDLKLSWLLPDFANFQLIPDSAQQLSALFVAVLLVVTFFFIIKSLFSYLGAVRRVGWLRKKLNGLSEDTVLEHRNDLAEAAEQQKDTIGHLWLEFDETLVEVKKSDRLYLYNILDAAHFFNSSTLAKGITENRLIAAVPGFLTAIGVIGTFVGLQLGLSELNISAGVSVDEMKSGVSAVINGAKIAFLTSVWGVSLSVFFNFIEKLLEQSIRRKISALQNQIDDIFPRLSAEAQLQEISYNSSQSRESLQGLAEKIGEKMQESLVQATQGIQAGLEASLEKIMAPAINKLVNETSEGNQKALEELISKFMDGFGAQGAEQRQSMEQASDKVNAAVTGMNSTMEAFIKRLEASQDASSEREKQLIETISSQVSTLVDQSSNQGRMLTQFLDDQVSRIGSQLEERERASSEREKNLSDNLTSQVGQITAKVAEQGDKMASFVNDQLSGLVSSMDERDQRVAAIEKERSDAIHRQVEEVGRSTTELLSSIETSIQNQQSAANAILEQGRVLQQSVESSIHANAEATSGMRESAKELRTAADNMNVLSSHIRDAGNKLSGAISEAVDSTKDLAEQNHQSAKRIESLRDELVTSISQFKELANQIDQMIENVDGTFNTLKSTQKEFLSEQKQHVTDLSKQVATLLADYAQQANSQTAEHLKIWSESTTQYAEQMNNAARALSSVVDEIEDKVA